MRQTKTRTQEEQREDWRLRAQKYREEGRDLNEIERKFYDSWFKRKPPLPEFTFTDPKGKPVIVYARSKKEAAKRIKSCFDWKKSRGIAEGL